MMLRLVLAVGFAAALAAPTRAVQPDEMLADPALEARAREISQEIRCLVCRNENIDDSNADLAHDLRVIVRERLVAGDTDAEVKQFLVDRYGEFVLLKPSFHGANLILWLGGPALLVLGGIAAFIYVRRRSGAAEEPALSTEERARLEALLRE